VHSPDHEAIRLRAFELSLENGGGTADENWLRAEAELAGVAWDYDTAERDLEQSGLTLSRLPGEAGVMWQLRLPRGECVEEWEPGNAGLTPPDGVAQLIDTVVGGKPLAPAPPLSSDPGAIRLRELLEEQRRELLRHDPGVRVGEDPENLHQHRVAARRARAFLRATRASLDPDWRRSLGNRLGELGDVTGPVRDLDVLLEHVTAELGSDGLVDARAAILLVANLDARREQTRRPLLELLDGEPYRRLLADLRQPPRLARNAETVKLAKIARREFQRLAARVDRLGKQPGESDLHGLRIDLKRARYVAELAAPDGDARRRFLADARALQDLLGDHQDALTAERLLRTATVWDDATAVAFLGGRLAERQRTRRERVRARLPAAWKRLRKSGARLG
jgi:CHAD domain-containing protein